MANIPQSTMQSLAQSVIDDIQSTNIFSRCIIDTLHFLSDWIDVILLRDELDMCMKFIAMVIKHQQKPIKVIQRFEEQTGYTLDQAMRFDQFISDMCSGIDFTDELEIIKSLYYANDQTSVKLVLIRVTSVLPRCSNAYSSRSDAEKKRLSENTLRSLQKCKDSINNDAWEEIAVIRIIEAALSLIESHSDDYLSRNCDMRQISKMFVKESGWFIGSHISLLDETWFVLLTINMFSRNDWEYVRIRLPFYFIMYEDNVFYDIIKCVQHEMVSQFNHYWLKPSLHPYVFDYMGLTCEIEHETRHEVLDKAIIQMIGDLSPFSQSLGSDMMWFVGEILIKITRSSDDKQKRAHKYQFNIPGNVTHWDMTAIAIFMEYSQCEEAISIIRCALIRHATHSISPLMKARLYR